MTVLETERLIRRISDLLQQGGNSDTAPKLAGDFAAACHAANRRLQQCEAMIKAGDRHQAIQLAETSPNLLDVVTVLEFRNADDWRAFCQQNALPVAERIDARAVRALNDCYGEGISTDHPLYAAYRKAVLNRNDEEALRALQSIARLNPTDTNATSELARLDAKVLGTRLEQLGGVVEGGDPALVVAGIEAIEAFGFKTRPQGEIWCKAEIVRCAVLLDEAGRLKAASQWLEALAKLDLIRRIERELKLELSASFARQIEVLESWAREEREKDRKNREFEALIAELYYRVQQSEEKDTSARYVRLPELRDDFEGLHKVWRSLVDFTRPIPEGAAATFRKRSTLLEAEIARRTAIRRRTILVSSAAALFVGGIIVWLVLGQMKAREFAGQLQAAVSQRHVRGAEALLERVRTSEKRLLRVGSLNAAVASAESFARKERGLLANFESAFGRLPKQLNSEADAARVNATASQLVATRAALDALAPDLKSENEPRVQAFEKRWQGFLAETGASVNGLLEQWIASAEKQCGQLDYRAPIETATGQIAALSAEIQRITDCEGGFTNHVSLRGDLRQRAAAARSKFAAYDRELRKVQEGMAAVKKARAFPEFAAAVALVASSEFTGTPAVAAASSVQLAGVNDEAALRYLLGATNPTTWAFIKKTKTTRLFPEIAMPAERSHLQRLNDDPAVNANHQFYRLWLDNEGTKNVEWITAGAFEKSQGWHQIKAWTPLKTAVSAAFEAREYGYFDGQWKLSPTQPVFRLEQSAVPNETSAFGEIGLSTLWSGGSTYGKPGLEILDNIKDSRHGSPVFRAYLFCCMVELMEFQPDGWGLSFCPTARAHAAEIRRIAGGPVASGDWFIQSKARSWTEGLEAFFAASKGMSYAKEAAANFILVRAMAEDGLRYVGFVGMDGKPVLSDAPPATEIWAYEASSRRPSILSASAMPLSPLFALAAARSDYMRKAGLNGSEGRPDSALPPLFRITSQP